MADAGSFGDWSRQNLRTAIKGALDFGVLKRVSKGRGYARYMLPKPSKSTPDRTGLESNPNVTDTPLPPAPTVSPEATMRASDNVLPFELLTRASPQPQAGML